MHRAPRAQHHAGLEPRYQDALARFVAAVAPQGAAEAVQLSGLSLKAEVDLARQAGQLRYVLCCCPQLLYVRMYAWGLDVIILKTAPYMQSKKALTQREPFLQEPLKARIFCLQLLLILQPAGQILFSADSCPAGGRYTAWQLWLQGRTAVVPWKHTPCGPDASRPQHPLSPWTIWSQVRPASARHCLACSRATIPCSRAAAVCHSCN